MLRKIIKYLYILLIIIYVFTLLKKNELPPKSSINPSLFDEPIQSETKRDDFNFSYRDQVYNILPIADYEIWGLVVSVNNINAWYNYYHDENTVNLKDVCVIWGENIENEIYLDPRTKFSSGEWTCYYEWWSNDDKKIFPNKLSNNHLLTADIAVQQSIKNVRVGDQIYLKGSLVDYAELGTEWYRKTSVSRNDSNQSSRSGGACEIFYVDNIEIIQKNQPLFNIIHEWSKKIFLSLVIFHFTYIIIRSSMKKSYFKEN